MLIVYGIPNCSSVKKTRVWLDEHKINYLFHDFKKQGIDEATLRNWLNDPLAIPLETIINKRGTTWRQLSLEDQNKANNMDGAIELMMNHTSVIKRPVIISDKNVLVGHNEADLSRFILGD